MLRFKNGAQTGYQSWRPVADSSTADGTTASLDAAQIVDVECTELARTSPYGGWHPKAVIGRLRHAWESLVADSPWPAMHAASHVFTAGILIYFGGAILECMFLSRPLRHLFGDSGEQLISQIWIWGAGCLIPVLAGSRMGLRYPRRGALGTLFALSIMALLASPFFLCFNAYARACPDLVGAMFHRDTILISELVVAVMCSGPVLAGWLVIGGLAALFTGIAKRLRASEKRYAAWFASGLGAKGSAAVTHFLDAVDYHLKSLAADTRLDIRNELSQHIESLAAAHVELGEERDEATSSALRQFGDPRMIARRFCRAWAATAKETPWLATRAALKLVIGVTLSYLLAATFVEPSLHLSFVDESNLLWGVLSVLPVFIGVRIGLRFPSRGVRATFYGTSIVALAAYTTCYWNLRFGGYLLDGGGDYGSGASGTSASWFLWQATNHLAVNAMMWLPVASLSAAVAATCSKVRDHLQLTHT